MLYVRREFLEFSAVHDRDNFTQAKWWSMIAGEDQSFGAKVHSGQVPLILLDPANDASVEVPVRMLFDGFLKKYGLPAAYDLGDRFTLQVLLDQTRIAVLDDRAHLFYQSCLVGR